MNFVEIFFINHVKKLLTVSKRVMKHDYHDNKLRPVYEDILDNICNRCRNHAALYMSAIVSCCRK
jgi:hypothetical protein